MTLKPKRTRTKLNVSNHAFDIIIAEVCHRGYTAQVMSIWREIVNHFDAIKIGLTATPAHPVALRRIRSRLWQRPNGLSKRTDAGETGRFRKFRLSEIKERGYKLEITWLKDESLEHSDEPSEPQDLASEAISDLEAVVDDLRDIVELLEKEEGVEK